MFAISPPKEAVLCMIINLIHAAYSLTVMFSGAQHSSRVDQGSRLLRKEPPAPSHTPYLPSLTPLVPEKAPATPRPTSFSAGSATPAAGASRVSSRLKELAEKGEFSCFQMNWLCLRCCKVFCGELGQVFTKHRIQFGFVLGWVPDSMLCCGKLADVR